MPSMLRHRPLTSKLSAALFRSSPIRQTRDHECSISWDILCRDLGSPAEPFSVIEPMGCTLARAADWMAERLAGVRGISVPNVLVV